jgi:dethiobiotin synthetase
VISALVSPSVTFHRERYLLDEPASPHQAAYNQGMELRLADINLPQTKNDLIIEGAGGVMVPINQTELMLDLIAKLADKVVLVANLYLGSINHTLLTIDALQNRGQKIMGIVFNGPLNQHSESIIKSYSGCGSLLHLLPDSIINAENIKQWAQVLRKNLTWTY